MYKNFAAQGLGISGRQSELIELAMTYAFTSLDVDMAEMLRRVQRSDYESAARFLAAAKIKDRKLQISGFEVPVSLDADDEAFAAQLVQLHPIAEIAGKLECKIASIIVPAGTDRLPYHEFFEVITKRIGQIADALATHNIKLAIGFDATAEAAEGKEFEFVRNVEGFLPLVRGAGENTSFLLDTFSWFAGGGTMEQLQELKVDQIGAVRLSSVADSAEADTIKHEHRTLPELGGAIDFSAITKMLSDGNYEGPISAYVGGGSVRGSTRDALLEKTSDVLDSIFKEVGLEVFSKPMDEIVETPVEVAE